MNLADYKYPLKTLRLQCRLETNTMTGRSLNAPAHRFYMRLKEIQKRCDQILEHIDWVEKYLKVKQKV